MAATAAAVEVASVEATAAGGVALGAAEAVAAALATVVSFRTLSCCLLQRRWLTNKTQADAEAVEAVVLLGDVEGTAVGAVAVAAPVLVPRAERR